MRVIDPKSRVIQFRRKLKTLFTQMAPLLPPKLKEELEAGSRLLSEEVEKLRLQTLSKAERQREDDEREERQFWAEVAQSIGEKGSTKFYDALRFFGPRVFAEPDVQAELHKLWEDALDNEKARAWLAKICPPLAALDRGRPPLSTETERKKNRRESKARSQAQLRAHTYAERAWKLYEEKKATLKRRGIFDAQTLRQAAEVIVQDKLSRKGNTVTGARKLFLQKLNSDLKNIRT